MHWEYLVMHLDTMVATIRSDGLCHIFFPDFLPYNLYLEEDDDISTLANNLAGFYYWCSSRLLPLGRVYAKEMLHAICTGIGITDRSTTDGDTTERVITERDLTKRDIAKRDITKRELTERDRANIALSYRCVTLTDVFWVKRPDESLTFQEISLYDHPLSDAFVDVSLLGKKPTVQNWKSITPLDLAADLSTQGNVPKAWIRRDGIFYLLKNGERRDIEAELLASKVAQCFPLDQVLYEAANYHGQKVTCSRLFTSTEYSIAPIEHVDLYAANHDTDRATLISAYDLYGFHMMNIIDYLIGNVDRHWGNWGFLIDNETNLPVKLHPLMDFNKSFLAYDRLEGARCLTTASAMSQMEAAIQGVKAVGLNQVSAVRREWFVNEAQWEMFSRRLRVLKENEGT